MSLARIALAFCGISLVGTVGARALTALADATAEDEVDEAVDEAPTMVTRDPGTLAHVAAAPAEAAPAEVPSEAAPAEAAPAEAAPAEAAPAEAAVEGEAEAEDDQSAWVGPPDPLPDCEAQLEAAGVEFSASQIPLHKTRGGIHCGAEQIVRYRQGPEAIRWGGSPKVTCPVALGMAKLETIVQQEAERHLGRKVRRIQHMGTYNCREMANYPGWVSEHSYANAIDIKHFELANGKTIPVLGTYPKNGATPKTAGARFLKAVARRLYDERVFSVVLTPSFDSAHRNHFHLDMARYLVDGT